MGGVYWLFCMWTYQPHILSTNSDGMFSTVRAKRFSSTWTTWIFFIKQLIEENYIVLHLSIMYFHILFYVSWVLSSQTVSLWFRLVQNKQLKVQKKVCKKYSCIFTKDIFLKKQKELFRINFRPEVQIAQKNSYTIITVILSWF